MQQVLEILQGIKEGSGEVHCRGTSAPLSSMQVSKTTVTLTMALSAGSQFGSLDTDEELEVHFTSGGKYYEFRSAVVVVDGVSAVYADDNSLQITVERPRWLRVYKVTPFDHPIPNEGAIPPSKRPDDWLGLTIGLGLAGFLIFIWLVGSME